MMRADYLTLDEKPYRVEINMEACDTFEELSGMQMSRFEILAAEASSKQSSIKTSIMLYWLFAGLKAGAVLEGKTFLLSFEELKRALRPSDLAYFITSIFVPQYMGIEEGKEINQPKKKKERRRLRFLTALLRLKQ